MPIASLPKGTKILRTKWVYDDKKGMDGKIARFKARLTAMGNFQREGVDYFDTYASVMRTKTLRVLLQLLNASPEHEMEHTLILKKIFGYISRMGTIKRELMVWYAS